VFGMGGDAAEASSRAQEEVSKNSRDTGSRLAGRAGPFGAHCWAPRECGCMRLAYVWDFCMCGVWGISMCGTTASLGTQ